MIVHAHYPLGEPRVEREAGALLKRGWNVDVICLKGKDESSQEMVAGVNVYRLPVQRHRGKGPLVQFLEYMVFFLMAAVKVTALDHQKKYASVQAHNLPDFLIFSALFPKLRGARVLLDLHDLMPEFFAASFRRDITSLPARLLIFQEQISCRFADQVITVTEPWRQTLIQRGVPAHKVAVVMNVADSGVFQRNGYAIRPANGTFHIMYHGTITHRYGVDLLLKAFRTLEPKIPGLKLTIHGRGEYLDELKALAQEAGLDGKVCFSSEYMPIADLAKFLQQGDVGVVPYRRNIFTDGILPTKMMEYVALGLPVVAARTPVISHYFDESMAEFFTPEDAQDLAMRIYDLYLDPDRRSQLSEQAAQFYQTYNWEKTSAGYAALIENQTN